MAGRFASAEGSAIHSLELIPILLLAFVVGFGALARRQEDSLSDCPGDRRVTGKPLARDAEDFAKP
jgi:hypothetical protein